MNNIFNDVNIVFAANARRYQIRCRFEESHSAPVNLATGLTDHLSRVDMSWLYSYNRRNFYTFAILEFKHPEAIRQKDWFGTPNSTVLSSGEKICRQLKKNAYSFSLCCIGACDLNTLLLLHLEGERKDWFSSTPFDTLPIPAQFRCITQADQMKRQMYVFLKEALDEKLRDNGHLA
jgi:hypothetical protein